MTARRIGVLAALVVMGASGWYVFVYLYRWEWNRALMSGLIFLIAEIGLLGVTMLARLSRVDQRLAAVEHRPRRHVSAHGFDADGDDSRIAATLREHRPPPAKPFAWLGRDQGQQLNVFVPVLMSAGVVLSGLAWLVDRLARATATPSVERSLTRALSTLRPPPGGMLGGRPDDPFRPR